MGEIYVEERSARGVCAQPLDTACPAAPSPARFWYFRAVPFHRGANWPPGLVLCLLLTRAADGAEGDVVRGASGWDGGIHRKARFEFSFRGITGRAFWWLWGRAGEGPALKRCSDSCLPLEDPQRRGEKGASDCSALHRCLDT